MGYEHQSSPRWPTLQPTRCRLRSHQAQESPHLSPYLLVSLSSRLDCFSPHPFRRPRRAHLCPSVAAVHSSTERSRAVLALSVVC